jgi:Ni/Co efflux regulator RcnB
MIKKIVLSTLLLSTVATSHAMHHEGGTEGISHASHTQEAAHDHHAHDMTEHTVDAMHSDTDMTASAGPTITRTPEIEAALAAGGEPVVADVLGVVCDFCATAMNKIFGKREEVAAVYVDLDTKALSLVLHAGQTLSDTAIGELAEQAGYRIAAVRRSIDALGS